MSNKQHPDAETIYQIRIKGHLGQQWTGWFEGMTIIREDNGETTLTGTVVDQAALHGVLRKVRNLALPLISVNRIQPGQTDAPDTNPKID